MNVEVSHVGHVTRQIVAGHHVIPDFQEQSTWAAGRHKKDRFEAKARFVRF